MILEPLPMIVITSNPLSFGLKVVAELIIKLSVKTIFKPLFKVVNFSPSSLNHNPGELY